MNSPPASHSPLSRYGFAWLPILLAVVAMVGLWVADLRAVWFSPALNWLVFYGSAFVAVVFIVMPAARSFLANGQASVLMLGCGVLVSQIGAAAMPTGFAQSTSTGFAIYNTSILLSALCHFTGVAITSRRKARARRSAGWLMAAYAGVTCAMGLVIWLALEGRMPVFFIDGQGGTLLRTLVVSAAVGTFVLTAGLLWLANRRRTSTFRHWYALGLVLVAVGLAGSMVITVRDSPLQWVTRFTQALGLIYICVAVLASARDSGARGIPLAAVEEAWPERVLLAVPGRQTVLGWVFRCAMAVAAVAAAFALYRAGAAWVGPGLPAFITFYPAVIVAALVGGFGPGLVATALAGIIAAYWILPPVGQFALASPVDRLSLIIFTGMGLFMSVVAELYRSVRNKAAAYDREAALRETRREKELLANLLEDASQPFAVGYPDGRLGRLNPAFEQLTGYTAAELRALDWSTTLTPPEWREMEKQKLDELQRTGQPVRYEKEYVRKDGSRVPIELLVHLARDAEGKPEYYYSFLTDITERRRTQDALRENEARYRSLFHNMAEGFALHEIVTDRDGAVCDYRFLDVNPGFERLTGLAAADLIGRTVREALPGIEPHWIERYGHVALTGEPITIESYAAPLNRWYEVFAYRPAPGRFAAIFMDITARRTSERQLREAQRLESVGLLAGGIAHDFNNLLVGVIGNASLAQEMVAPDDPICELLDGILTTGESLAHLTRQMLAYSGKGRFYIELLNLSDFIPEMRALVQPSIPGKIELRFELEGGLPPIEADRGQIQQVFMNLVLNAAEAIGAEAGLITVKTSLQHVDGGEDPSLAPGAYVSLEVRDTGCGMDDVTRTRIFDPFFSTKFVGRGLGLAAVGGIVRGHKGAVTVTSAPGSGSCFTVLLPAAEAVPVVAPVRAGSADLSGTGTILVVDDENIVREIAKNTLERHGYKVLLADSGPAAIDIVTRHPGDIALVVLDLSMPGMGGVEVLPELRKIRPNAAVIVSSGYSEAETMRLFAGQDVSGFLQKPFTAIGMAEKVKTALR